MEWAYPTMRAICTMDILDPEQHRKGLMHGRERCISATSGTITILEAAEIWVASRLQMCGQYIPHFASRKDR